MRRGAVAGGNRGRGVHRRQKLFRRARRGQIHPQREQTRLRPRDSEVIAAGRLAVGQIQLDVVRAGRAARSARRQLADSKFRRGLDLDLVVARREAVELVGAVGKGLRRADAGNGARVTLAVNAPKLHGDAAQPGAGRGRLARVGRIDVSKSRDAARSRQQPPSLERLECDPPRRTMGSPGLDSPTPP